MTTATAGLEGMSYPDFVARLVGSDRAVVAVLVWLARAGVWCRKFPLRVRPHDARIEGYQDLGDIELSGGRFLEVKGVEPPFVDQASWPFRSVFVDSDAHIRRFDTEGRHPIAWVSVSSTLKAGAVIPATTRPEWKYLKTYDFKRRKIEGFWEVPPGLPDWVDLEDPGGVPKYLVK